MDGTQGPMRCRPLSLRSRVRAVAAAAGLWLTVASPGGAADQAVPASGDAVSFDLAPDAANRHALELEAGQLVDVELRERSSRLGLALLDPSGAPVARRESQADSITTVRLLTVAAVSGRHTLEVRALSPGPASGYAIRVAPPGSAGPV